MNEELKVSSSCVGVGKDKESSRLYKVSLVREWIDYRLKTGRLNPELELLKKICNSIAITPEEFYDVITNYCKEIGQPLKIGGKDA